MQTPDFLAASLPLFEADEVDVLEWSFDTTWLDEHLPPWMPDLLDDYAASGRLLGHGVSFSLLSAAMEAQQSEWLANLRTAFARRSYVQLSEHFGFMTARGFEFGAPMPVPFTDAALRIGRDRLKQLADAARVPIGLENLALAFSATDVRDQGPFLEALLEPVDGFLILDLHNVHCQAENFGIDPKAIVAAYPLDRVRELHVSGGSWSGEGEARIRQDTHDDSVPEPLFELTRWALERCPHVAHIILERLGDTIAGPADAAQLVADFRRLRALAGAPAIG